MGDKTGISWTDASWNPVTGCVKVSPGCDNCYAEAVTLRYKTGGAFAPGNEPTLHPKRLDQPTRWKRPRRIFVNSMSDLFWGAIDPEFLQQIWQVMLDNPRHIFQILTKRPKPALRLIQTLGLEMADHIWIGVSVEDQQRANERIPYLLAIPAKVRFLSVEPMLGPVDLSPYLSGHPRNLAASLTGGVAPSDRGQVRGRLQGDLEDHIASEVGARGVIWVICGGESGNGYRPFDVEWAKSIRDQCLAAGVAFFHKQHGGFRSGGKALLDGKEWHQWPGKLTPPVQDAQAVLL